MSGRLGPVKNEALAPAGTSKYVYARIFQDETGKVRDIAAGAWDTWADGDIADYASAQCVEKGTSGIYQGDEPTDLDYISESFTLMFFVRAGGSPALGDAFIGQQRIGLEALKALMAGATFGTVVTDAGNDADTFKTDLANTNNDAYKDGTITFYTGAQKGQTKKIANSGGYNGTSKVIQLEAGNAFNATPANGDKFFIYGRIN